MPLDFASDSYGETPLASGRTVDEQTNPCSVFPPSLSTATDTDSPVDTRCTTEAQGAPPVFWKETDPETGWLCQWFHCPFADDEDPDRIYFAAEP